MNEHHDPNRLNFSTNWNNKLDCNIFSTIRLHNPRLHYEGKEVEIWDNSTKPGKYRGRGKYVLVSTFKLCQLKPAAAMLDTGYNLPQTLNVLRTMYKSIEDLEKKDFAYIIVEKIKENNKQQSIFEK